MRSQKKRIVHVCLLFVLASLQIGAEVKGIMFRDLAGIKGPIEGVDKQGCALVIQKLGGIHSAHSVEIPIYAYWSSGETHRSQYLGYGWSIPLFESRMIQNSKDVYMMVQPDGQMRRFGRDPKDETLLRSRPPWIAKIRGSEIQAGVSDANQSFIPCFVFRQGRLVSMTYRNEQYRFLYKGRFLRSIQDSNQKKLVETMVDEQNQRFSGITFPDGNQVLFQQISRPVPHTIGKHPAILRNERSLGVIRFKEGGNIEFSYGINDDRLPTFTFGETQIVWDPERSTILSKDGWKYQIGIPKPAGNNIPMSRTDSDGHRESYLFLNLQETESM